MSYTPPLSYRTNVGFARQMNLSIEQIHWGGSIALMLSCFLIFCSVVAPTPSEMPLPRALGASTAPQIDIQLAVPTWSPLPFIQQAKEQLAFSKVPPRPDLNRAEPVIAVHFRQTEQCHRASLPARIGLELREGGALAIASSDSLLWLDVSHSTATICTRTPQDELVQVASWPLELTPPPLQTMRSEGSPFRSLADAKWGPDMLESQLAQNNSIYRTELFALRLDQWLVFQDARWQPLPDIAQANGRPLARIFLNGAKELELEGWEGSEYVRLSCHPLTLPPMRIRAEELLVQLRVRSNQQISCTLDKQCLILRSGDWAIKQAERWTILRSEREKQRALDGTLSGDLFALDRIEATGPTRSIGGRYFTANRLQYVDIERTVERRKARAAR